MTAFSLRVLAFLGCFSVATGAYAACSEQDSYLGSLPIFNAAAFVPAQDPIGQLDHGLMAGLGKVALFPHPQGAESLAEMLDVFPDLALAGSPAVILPDPLDVDDLGRLWGEVERTPERVFLLVGQGRFDLSQMIEKARQLPNLWLGFGDADVKSLLETCAVDALAPIADRVVYASLSDTVLTEFSAARLVRLATALPADQGEKFLHLNAERLYGVTTFAP